MRGNDTTVIYYVVKLLKLKQFVVSVLRLCLITKFFPISKSN